MRKSYLYIAVMGLMLASCSQDDTIETAPRQAITFGDMFVEKPSRTPIDNSYTLGKLKAFEVYGTLTNSASQTANLFNKELVSNSGSAWTYDSNNTQYWIPGNTYNFTAIVDGNVSNVTKVNVGANDMPVSIQLQNASYQTDILWAKSASIAYTSGEKTVDFNFEHLLAKAMFSVENGIKTDNGYSYKVKDICITNAASVATYTIGTGWGESEGSYCLKFGHIVHSEVGNLIGSNSTANAVMIGYNQTYESNYERLLIPTSVEPIDAKTTINVIFTYELYKDGKLIDTQNKEFSHKLRLNAGFAYKFNITLGDPGKPIKFSVQQINGWDKDTNDDTVDDEKDDITINP